jgi:hypothetical protein
MKRLVSSVLVLTLLGTAAASAQPYGGYERGMQRDHRGDRDNDGYRGYGWNRYSDGRWDDHRDYRRRNNDGALIGLGIGLFALGALAASSQHHSDYYRGGDGYYYRR